MEGKKACKVRKEHTGAAPGGRHALAAGHLWGNAERLRGASGLQGRAGGLVALPRNDRPSPGPGARGAGELHGVARAVQQAGG